MIGLYEMHFCMSTIPFTSLYVDNSWKPRLWRFQVTFALPLKPSMFPIAISDHYFKVALYSLEIQENRLRDGLTVAVKRSIVVGNHGYTSAPNTSIGKKCILYCKRKYFFAYTYQYTFHRFSDGCIYTVWGRRRTAALNIWMWQSDVSIYGHLFWLCGVGRNLLWLRSIYH